jgi:hypothetical protein
MSTHLDTVMDQLLLQVAFEREAFKPILLQQRQNHVKKEKTIADTVEVNMERRQPQTLAIGTERPSQKEEKQPAYSSPTPPPPCVEPATSVPRFDQNEILSFFKVPRVYKNHILLQGPLGLKGDIPTGFLVPESDTHTPSHGMNIIDVNYMGHPSKNHFAMKIRLDVTIQGCRNKVYRILLKYNDGVTDDKLSGRIRVLYIYTYTVYTHIYTHTHTYTHARTHTHTHTHML